MAGILSTRPRLHLVNGPVIDNILSRSETVFAKSSRSKRS